MLFSDFAKKLRPILKREDKYNYTNTADFCRQLFKEAVEQDDVTFDEFKRSLISAAENEISFKSDSTFDSYYYGNSLITPIAVKIAPVFDTERFARFVVPDVSLNIEQLCDTFIDEIPGINKDNLGQELANLFKEIVEKSPKIDSNVASNANSTAEWINKKLETTRTSNIPPESVSYPLSYDVFGYCDECYDLDDPEAANLQTHLPLSEPDLLIISELISHVGDYPSRHYKAGILERFKNLSESETILQEINRFRQSRSVKNLALYYIITLCYQFLRKYIKLLSVYTYEELKDTESADLRKQIELAFQDQTLSEVMAMYGNFMSAYQMLLDAQKTKKILYIQQSFSLPYFPPFAVNYSSPEGEEISWFLHR